MLSVLPGGKATLIVRVLEAFIALQYQAGVLTEEVVLAVQLLVEVSESRNMAHAWGVAQMVRPSVSRTPTRLFFWRLFLAPCCSYAL